MKVYCPACKRDVTVLEGKYTIHGPGLSGEKGFTCKNSGKKAPK